MVVEGRGLREAEREWSLREAEREWSLREAD